MAKADRHEISASGYPGFSSEWLAKYGYRSAVTYPTGAGAGHFDRSRGGRPIWVNHAAVSAALLFHRIGEPLQMAQVGDTLRYDGRKKIVVIDYREEENVAP